MRDSFLIVVVVIISDSLIFSEQTKVIRFYLIKAKCDCIIAVSPVDQHPYQGPS